VKKKIIVLNNSARFGGPQKSIIQNINILKENFEFIIITPKGSSLKNFLNNKIKCIISPELPQFENTLFNYYFGLKWLIIFRELIRFFNFLIFLIANRKSNEFQQIDVVHSNEINLIPAVYLVRKILKPKKIISHCRSLQNNKKTFISKKLKKIYYKNLDEFIFIDKIVAKTVDTKLPKNIIYNSFNKENVLKSKKTKNKFIIGVAGNISDVKGTDFIIETFKELKKKNISNIYLYILGDIPGNSFLSKIADIIGIKKNYHKYLEKIQNLENIFFLGYRDKIEDFYQNINLLCFPTKINAVGRTIIEASQFKIPCVITTSPKIKDLDIANDQNSFFFKNRNKKKFANKLIEISKDKLRCKLFGEKIFRHICKKCKIEENTNKLRYIYNNLINK
jgi:glycosyltransferase involved in cell wall biosynthesis